ncbi:MAG: hypothetical protein Q7S74_00230 [Nanoarchaeota archaeon]|nr:hypothetical protein [Nanoarchaeota archaeon]
MENVIRKIFLGKCDEEVHSDFVKFSKGVFENRYLLDGKAQKDKWSIKSSAEFGNFFVRAGLEKINSQIQVTGAIISTLDLQKDINFPIENVKRYMGIKQLIINTKIDPKNILQLMIKYPKAFYALSFSIEGYELKIKAKAPKSGKPSGKGEAEPKADFCSLKTSNKDIVNDLFFDYSNFKDIFIKHILNITEIVIPQNVKDPKEIRELSKRKGVLKRIVKVDNQSKTSEKDFLA